MFNSSPNLVFFLILLQQTSAEDDTSYSPVSNKDKDDPQNGAYIGLTSKSEQQAWDGVLEPPTSRVTTEAY